MKQEHFEHAHATDWDAFAQWLVWHRTRQGRNRLPPPFPANELPLRYRRLCQQLALARDRDYGMALVERLHRLALDGHDALYGAQGDFGLRVLRYASGGFAADVRAQARWVLAAALLMFGPMLAAMLAVRAWPEFAYHILSPAQIGEMESMYGPQTHELGRVARDAATDFSMFGFYIFNNVSIAFRCFAGGLTAGLLSVWALVFNGLVMGAVEARLALAGYGTNFYSFVVGHSSFELGAIVLSGASGLRLGAALVAPSRRSRAAALRETARGQIGIVCGFALMLVAAALVEAFWSPLRLPLPLKLGVGGAFLCMTLAYFMLAGRDDGA